MKIQFSPKDFLRKFRLVADAASTRGIRPILQNVKIVADKRRGTFLMATDTDMGIRVCVDADVSENGNALLPVKRLVKMLPLFKDESVTLESSKTGIVLQAGSKRSELETMAPDEFPDVTGVGRPATCVMTAWELRETIDRVIFAVDKDGCRHAQTGVCFESDGKMLDVVATDGWRMAWQQIGGVESSFARSIVPAETLKLVDKVLKDKIVDVNADVEVAIDAHTVEFRCGDVMVFSRLIDGKFPAWKAIIPDKRELSSVVVDCEALLSGIRRATICTDKGCPEVRLALADGKLTVSASFSETVSGFADPVVRDDGTVHAKKEFFKLIGTSRIAVPVSGFSGHGTLAIDPKRLTGFLSACPKSTVLTLYFPSHDGMGAMFELEDGYTFLAMPIVKSVDVLENDDIDEVIEPETDTIGKPTHVAPADALVSAIKSTVERETSPTWVRNHLHVASVGFDEPVVARPPKRESIAVVSDEVMIGMVGKKSVQKPPKKPRVDVGVEFAQPTSVDILAEMVRTAKTKREIGQISSLAYSMARKNRQYADVSRLADEKLCTIYGVR